MMCSPSVQMFKSAFDVGLLFTALQQEITAMLLSSPYFVVIQWALCYSLTTVFLTNVKPMFNN